ncbi:MAG: glycosyl hydrolase [Flavobacteriales bacterium]|nr:glycosyl hydrolase [Flavobacteriales bacterium]
MKHLLLSFLIAIAPIALHAQANRSKAKPEAPKTDHFSGLKFRSIGPAFMSGRIADIAIHPQKASTWYVAVGSGGVWKTENAGTTWTPIFDGQTSYSIGCITLDPQNPEVLWVGTGENVGGRHVAYGDGIYRSMDGGKSWTNLGLKNSEHLSKIIVHPADPNTVWVAAQGPLWSKGGERGVYKTTDGGKTWRRTLGDAEWVGATDLLIDPREPNLLYAATWQRHRTVAGYMGGGPGSAIHRSSDGGETWTKLSSGLPAGNLGKIGLALSPQRPDVVYAAIEEDRRTGGVYRSSDRGMSWTKMSDAVSGGTGPHYYQELYACPHQFDRLYLVSNYLLTSDDGGKNFRRVNVEQKHVDDHAIAFSADDPDHLLVGTDGGLYESFDRARTWRYIANLPVTQFYKIAVDDAEPFYNVYGGTQDNCTQGGPSRTDNIHGIRNDDWYVVLGGDGHQPATEPGNPNIVYAQWQQGNIVRHDRTTGENTYIRPQPAEGEPTERSNWDAPIVVSPHDPATLYFGTQRVWKSADRGDTWTALSGDLTTNTERIRTPYFGTTQGWDNPWDIYAMSDYSSITSLGVSPVVQGLIYAGTDDGLLQVTEDEGRTWRRIEVGRLPGLPATAFCNDIKADLHDANTVFAVFDNHKYGDFKPYIYRSTDRGRTWTSIASGLPERTLLWRVVQDHVKPGLLFLGTEFGVYVSFNGGREWQALKGGLPPIAVRDIAIQRKANDLVLGTFGRGIYILDDYAALREYTEDTPKAEATLFAPRTAAWYSPRQLLGYGPKGMLGDNYYVGANPEFGATFNYFLKEAYTGPRKQRQEAEKKLKEESKPLAFPGWDAVEAEERALEPGVWLVISDAQGKVVDRVKATNSAGFQRVTWDLRASAARPVTRDNMGGSPRGPLVAPGTYTAQLYKQQNGAFTAMSATVPVRVEPLRKGHLPGATPDDAVAYQQRVEALRGKQEALQQRLKEASTRSEVMRTAYTRATRSDAALQDDLLKLHRTVQELDLELNGSKARAQVGEKNAMLSAGDRLGAASGAWSISYGPTPTHRANADIAERMLGDLELRMNGLIQGLPALEERLKAIGAPALEWR